MEWRQERLREVTLRHSARCAGEGLDGSATAVCSCPVCFSAAAKADCTADSDGDPCDVKFTFGFHTRVSLAHL